ncbi:hypothetical protein [Compostimonas suwonensis]|uniref:Uncharacterized protein n=1 Tax=Compostimonas suwonensis TaxID=1048394 RepID=A0A2M9C0J1_9MICO|nr:hypothetical protein [Compostimonas suwonensis]PJJ63871.1 hypothetical protein CLV54_1550 [Compostimonas suwonensis]
MDTPWWNIDGAPTPDEWTALFAGLTLVAAIIAAVIALRQLRAHFETARAQSRPYVIVDFAFKSILMQVEIKNIGATAASELTLRVTPPFESGLREQAATLNAVFSEPERISMLAPGRRILYTFDRAPDYHEAKRPERYAVTASYTDMPVQYHRPWRQGWHRQEIRYTETFVLDFRQWSQATTESDYDNMNWNIAKRQERRTEKAVNALTSIAATIKRRSEELQGAAVTLDVVEQSELRSNAAIEHPVDVPPREPEPADFELERNTETPNSTTRGLWSKIRQFLQ